MQKIKKGDQVIVIAGKDKGKKGEVLVSFPSINKAVVKGINIVKKTVKKSKQHQQGGFVEVEAPIHISNLMLFCPKCGRGVRTRVLLGDNLKVRVCKKCGNKFE